MPRSKLPQAVVPPDSADRAEQLFYEALQRGDVQALMGCWLDDEAASCVHPGGPRILGAEAIRASFEAIFAHGVIDIHLHEVRRWQSEHLAVHSVVERVDVPTDDGPQSAWVWATNVYVATAAGWRMLSHHASPGMPALAPSPGGSAATGSNGSVLH
jgi:ketosteroid isomerase-like protein